MSFYGTSNDLNCTLLYTVSTEDLLVFYIANMSANLIDQKQS